MSFDTVTIAGILASILCGIVVFTLFSRNDNNTEVTTGLVQEPDASPSAKR